MRRRVLLGVFAGFQLAGCAGSVVVTKPATDELRGVQYCLPRTVLEVAVNVQIEGSGDDIRPSATLGITAHTVADHKFRYVLEHDTDNSSDDDLKVHVGASGLLESVTSESTQKGRALADEALRTAVAAAKLAATQGVFGLQSTKAMPNHETTLSVRTRIETALRRVQGPHVLYIALPEKLSDGVQVVNPFPEDMSWTLNVSVTAVDVSSEDEGEGNDPKATGPHRRGPVKECDGIVVRGAQPFTVSATLNWDWLIPGTAQWLDDSSEQSNWARQRGLQRSDPPKGSDAAWGFRGPLMSATGMVQLPDYSPVTVVPIDRAMFVTTKHSATFSGGVLTSLEVNRPSPVAAIAGFPGDVLEAAIALPAQIIQLQISNADSAAQLAAKQVEVEAAAQTAADAQVEDRAERLNAYIDAHAAAEAAYAAWQDAIDTDKELELATAAAKAMTTANAKAVLAGKPRPYKATEFPDLDKIKKIKHEKDIKDEKDIK